jgi:hypothetical protein
MHMRTDFQSLGNIKWKHLTLNIKQNVYTVMKLDGGTSEKGYEREKKYLLKAFAKLKPN